MNDENTSPAEPLAEIIKVGQVHLNALVSRHWASISEILDEEEEITLNLKLKITNRGAEEGNHAEVDHRLKTTISFATKVSDSIDAALSDPNQPELGLGEGEEREKRPEDDGRRIPLVGYKIVTRGKVKIGDKIWDPTERRWVDGDSYDGEQVALYAAVARPEASATPPESTAGTAGQTNVGAALTQAAAGSEAPKIKMDLTPGKYSHDQLTKEFRRAAKEAEWTKPQVDLIISRLRECDSVSKMLDTLAPHVEAPKSDDAKIFGSPEPGNN